MPDELYQQWQDGCISFGEYMAAMTLWTAENISEAEQLILGEALASAMAEILKGRS